MAIISKTEEKAESVKVPTPASISRTSLPRFLPSGLEDLIKLDQLHVHQKANALEPFRGMKGSSSYVAKDSRGKETFKVSEDPAVFGCFRRQGQKRPFTLMINDWTGSLSLMAERPAIETISCFCLPRPTSDDRVNIYDNRHSVIGSVIAIDGRYSRNYIVLDIGGAVALTIQGPQLLVENAEFKVLDLGQRQVGLIAKKWDGLSKEIFTGLDVFSVGFPPSMHWTLKATLLSAVFLIDFMHFYETDEQKRKR